MVLASRYGASYQLVKEKRSGSTALNTTYLYDAAGNRIQKIDIGALTTYLYNPAQELTWMQPPTGQPTTSLWDANGNLAVENAGGQLTSYSWDANNRMTGVAYSTGTLDTSSYAADDMRRQKITSAGTVEFVWDQQNVLQETDGTGATQAQYTAFPGNWGGPTSQRQSGASAFYVFDQQANTRLLASAAGAATDRYLYTTFGEELSVSGITVNPLRFGAVAGYYRDLAVRLYAGIGYYEPVTAAWVSQAPLGRGTSLYPTAGGIPRAIRDCNPQIASAFLQGVCASVAGYLTHNACLLCNDAYCRCLGSALVVGTGSAILSFDPHPFHLESPCCLHGPIKCHFNNFHNERKCPQNCHCQGGFSCDKPNVHILLRPLDQNGSTNILGIKVTWDLRTITLALNFKVYAAYGSCERG